MEKTAEQCNYSKQVNAEDCKKSSFTTQKNHLMGAPQLPFAETFPCGSKTPLTQYQPNSLHPFAVPYASWAQFYSSPHVTATVFNGTTFYYYHGNPNPANGCQTNLTPTTNCDCFKRAQTSDAADQAHSERLSSINHGLPGHVTSPRSPNRRASFASISSTSSRSSSPFLSSIGSCNSARDSGLVSMTDDDTSSIHEPNHVETREDKLLLLVKEAAEEILSEKNLSQNSYLLRQMKRNQDGYVSIKLLASSKQIRKITNSHNLLLLALQSSKKLKVNKSNTKVKRRVPIINPLDARKTLTSLVLIDPRDINGIDDVTQKFKAYGEMAQIRIVRPGKPIPAYLKGYTNAIPKLGKVLCVIVEFEAEASVFRAYKDFSATNRESSVALLRPGIKRSINPTQNFDSTYDHSDSKLTKTTLDKLTSSHSKVTVTRLISDDSTDSQDSGVNSDELHSAMKMLKVK